MTPTTGTPPPPVEKEPELPPPQPPPTLTVTHMSCCSINCNGFRAYTKGGGLDAVIAMDHDNIVMQEIKIPCHKGHPEQFLERLNATADIIKLLRHKYPTRVWHTSENGLHGTLFLSKFTPSAVILGMPGTGYDDREGRTTTAIFATVIITTAYAPSAKMITGTDGKRTFTIEDNKTYFNAHDRFIRTLATAHPGKQILFMGDVNSIASEADAHRSIRWRGGSRNVDAQYMTTVQRTHLLTDVWKSFSATAGCRYTWFPMHKNDIYRRNRHGSRLDHAWVTPSMLTNTTGNRVTSFRHLCVVPGSDHIPIVAEINGPALHVQPCDGSGYVSPPLPPVPAHQQTRATEDAVVTPSTIPTCSGTDGSNDDANGTTAPAMSSGAHRVMATIIDTLQETGCYEPEPNFNPRAKPVTSTATATPTNDIWLATGDAEHAAEQMLNVRCAIAVLEAKRAASEAPREIPHIDVLINGQRRQLMADSGAARSLITTAAAIQWCGFTATQIEEISNLPANQLMFEMAAGQRSPALMSIPVPLHFGQAPDGSAITITQNMWVIQRDTPEIILGSDFHVAHEVDIRYGQQRLEFNAAAPPHGRPRRVTVNCNIRTVRTPPPPVLVPLTATQGTVIQPMEERWIELGAPTIMHQLEVATSDGKKALQDAVKFGLIRQFADTEAAAAGILMAFGVGDLAERDGRVIVKVTNGAQRPAVIRRGDLLGHWTQTSENEYHITQTDLREKAHDNNTTARATQRNSTPSDAPNGAARDATRPAYSAQVAKRDANAMQTTITAANTTRTTAASHGSQATDGTERLATMTSATAIAEEAKRITKGSEIGDIEWTAVVDSVFDDVGGAGVAKLINLLRKPEYRRLFTKERYPSKRDDYRAPEMQLSDDKPSFVPPRRIASAPHADEVRRQIHALLKEGRISPSESPWAAAVVLAHKKDGTWRMAIDYRGLNKKTIGLSYPLPRVDDTLSQLRGAKYFTTVDVASAFHNVSLPDVDKEKTAFAVPGMGLFEWNVLPFGLKNASAVFSQFMACVVGSLRHECCLVYIDDVCVHSADFDTHLNDLDRLLARFVEWNIPLKPSKCFFFQRKVAFLGHIVTADGVAMDPKKTAAITNLDVPKDAQTLRAFLGMAGYYRRFIDHFAHVTEPLQALLRDKQPYPSVLPYAAIAAFNAIKRAMTTPGLILAHPDWTRPDAFEIHCDGCPRGIGATLVQIDADGKEHVIQYMSRSLSKAEKNYNQYKLEALAMHWAVRLCRPYITMAPFRIVTDASALRSFMEGKDTAEGTIGKWQMYLQQFTFTVAHRAGKHHCDADGLSRCTATPQTQCNEKGVDAAPTATAMTVATVTTNEPPRITSSATGTPTMWEAKSDELQPGASDLDIGSDDSSDDDDCIDRDEELFINKGAPADDFWAKHDALTAATQETPLLITEIRAKLQGMRDISEVPLTLPNFKQHQARDPLISRMLRRLRELHGMTDEQRKAVFKMLAREPTVSKKRKHMDAPADDKDFTTVAAAAIAKRRIQPGMAIPANGAPKDAETLLAERVNATHPDIFARKIEDRPLARQWGVFARTTLDARRSMGRYKGVRRAKRPQDTSQYLVELDMEAGFVTSPTVIDATTPTDDNWARFIDHSDTPNVQFVQWEGEVYVVTLRELQAGEQLLANYESQSRNNLSTTTTPLSVNGVITRGMRDQTDNEHKHEENAAATNAITRTSRRTRARRGTVHPEAQRPRRSTRVTAQPDLFDPAAADTHQMATQELTAMSNREAEDAANALPDLLPDDQGIRIPYNDEALYKGFTEVDGVLRCVYNTHKSTIVVPRSMVDSVLRHFHGLPVNGHMGHNKTYNRINLVFSWKGMRKDVKRFINACRLCQKRKPPRPQTKGLTHSLRATRPWQFLCIDFFGCWPESPNGNKWILTMHDQFTRWPIAVPMKTRNARAIMDVIMREIVFVHGPPEWIWSDREPGFAKTAMKHIYRRFGINKAETTGEQPQANSSLERFHHYMAQALTFVVNEHKTDWEEWLPVVLWMYRISTNETTGLSPYNMLYGREPRLPVEVQLGINANVAHYGDEREYAHALYERVQNAYAMARNAQLQQKAKDRARRDQGRNAVPEDDMPPGSWVMFWEPELKPPKHSTDNEDVAAAKLKTPKKVEYKYRGPFMVKSRCSCGLHRIIVHTQRQCLVKANVNRLRTFTPYDDVHFNTDRSTPLEEATTCMDSEGADDDIEWGANHDVGDLVAIPFDGDTSEPFGIGRILQLRPQHEWGHKLQWYSNTKGDIDGSFLPGWILTQGDGSLRHYFAHKPRSKHHTPYTNEITHTRIENEHIARVSVELTDDYRIPDRLLARLRERR